MAAADPRAELLEEATCSICRDLYTDPVTLDCGHNFCLSCFNTFKSKEDLEKACPECKERFDLEKEMKPNKRLANMVEAAKKLQIAPGSLCEEHGERLHLICETDGKLLCVFCRESQAHREHRVTLVKKAEQEHKDVRSTLDRCTEVKFQCPEGERKEKETTIQFVKTHKPEEKIKKYEGGSCRGTDELRLVLVGCRGGKCETGNSLLGREEFKTRVSGWPVIERCQRAEGEWGGRPLVVVDTPGLFDSHSKQFFSEMERCRQLSAPGPHALLLLLEPGRFTLTETLTATTIQLLFGPEALQFTVLVFTQTVQPWGESLETFVRDSDCEKCLRELVQRCGGRVCGFDNLATGAESEEQVRGLMQVIDKMMEGNGGRYLMLGQDQEAPGQDQ